MSSVIVISRMIDFHCNDNLLELFPGDNNREQLVNLENSVALVTDKKECEKPVMESTKYRRPQTG